MVNKHPTQYHCAGRTGSWAPRCAQRGYRRGWMQCLCCLLVFMSLTRGVYAQQSKGRYEHFLGNGGSVYFIKPRQVKPQSGMSTRFCYDMTYNISKQDVVLNFTFQSPHMEQITAFALCLSADTLCPDTLGLLYVEPRKKGYEFRFTTTFPYARLREAFVDETRPLTFCITQGSVTSCHGYKPSAWKKEMARMKEIFSLIDFQKQ